MNLFDATEVVRRHPWLGYALGLAGFALALWARFEIGDALVGFPYITFFPVVILTAFIGGTGPGVFAAALCGLAAWYLFIPPEDTWDLVWPDGYIALGFYAFIVGIDIAIIHTMNKALDRLRAERARSGHLLDEQRTMFQELQHRVANNMAFVSSLLTLQKRKAASDPASTLTAFDEARERLDTMARIHRRLYDPASVNLPVGQYLQELCSDLLDATGAKNIVCMCDVPAITLDIQRLVTLSLLVTEVVTNALKHAFDEGQRGTIAINLEPLDGNRLTLTIADNGRGLPSDFTPSRGRSLGIRIAHGLAAQLGGELSYRGNPAGPGTAVTVSFPAQPRQASSPERT